MLRLINQPTNNEITCLVPFRNELEDYAEQLEQQNQWKSEAEEKKKLELFASKHHYLLSTEVKPGIYNSPFQP